LACVTKAIFEVAQLQNYERVLILGPGPIGLLTLLAARTVGVQVSMVGRETDAKRLELAKMLGADQVYLSGDLDSADKIQERMGANAPDVIFECSGSGAAFRLALGLVRKQGRVIQIGLFGKNVDADLNAVVFKDLTIRGSFASSRASWDRAVELAGSGKLDLRALVSDVFALEDYEQAFRHAVGGSGLKVVFRPSSEDRATTGR
jgi:L-iditol 2-dehydrogenase